MKKLFTLGLLFSIAFCFAQSKSAADKHFKNFHYVKSAEIYEKIYQKGDSSQLVISRIGDSYYYNTKSVESEFWYRKLFTIVPEKEIPSEYYFRYAQSLKGNGKYKESDQWLIKFRKLNEDDSRGKQLEINSDYLEKYLKENETYEKVSNLSVNTAYSDFGISFFKDSLIYASTKPINSESKNKIYKWNNQPFLNLYQVKETLEIDKDEFVNSIELTESKTIQDINTKYHEASVAVTKDGKTLYFTRDNFQKKLKADKNRTVHLKIYRAKNINGKWGDITELPFNNDNYSVGHPALSQDEKTLYFVSDMLGGIGQTDLYKVAILSDSEFSEPVNLGRNINTEGREMFPFISSDNTLYFSSDGHLGLGALDIFSSNFTENSFLGIENLGKPINSKKDDFAFVLSTNKSYGYLSSNRDGGKGDDDIYSFVKRKPVIVKDTCSQKIVGIIKDKYTGKLLPGSKISLFDNAGKKVDSMVVGKDAAFNFTLPCNNTYRLVGFKRYYKPDEQSFLTGNGVGIISTKKIDLQLNDDFTYSESGEIIVNINPIYFDLNKSNIRPDAAKELDKVVAVMLKYPQLIIQSGSHTDSRGSDLYNQKLSERRANSTVQYIISKGISSNRISGKGYGETAPVNKCVNGVWCNDKAHQLNRRTEFLVILRK